MPARSLTRAQALSWNSNWSHTDIETLVEHIARLGAVAFYRPESGGYTACVRSDGRRVMFIHAGYVKFAKGLAPPDRPNQDWEGIDLSTIRGKSAGQRTPGGREKHCPIHGMPILPTVGCESCD